MKVIARTAMGKLLVVLIFFCVAGDHLKAQDKTLNWQNYINSKKDSADNNHYVYLYYTRGGQREKIVQCFLYKNEQLMAINKGDTLITEAFIKKPEIFKYLAENKKFLNAVRRDRSKEKHRKNYRKDFNDTTITFQQLGIRIKGLHYNHFQRTTPAFIATLSNKKKIKGYRAINHMIDIIESSALQSEIEKN